MSRHAVIMAGGPGTRLWPMSRRGRPKQVLPFGPGGKSLLQASLERLVGLFDAKEVYVIAGADQIPAIREELPELPAENLIGEPQPRDTANAIALACAILAEKDRAGTVAVFTADHVIEPLERFQDAVRAALDLIEGRPEYLGTFGIRPTRPHPGLGYIHRGEALLQASVPAFRVKAFKEKPDPATAQAYLDSGQYYWNSGMFVWKIDTILGQLRTFLPENTQRLMDLARSWGQSGWADRAAAVYRELKKISIDFAVMEKTPNVLVVELPCQWADVGNWNELSNVTGTDEAGNAVRVKKLVTLDSRGNVLVSSDDEHLIAAIGITELIVIHTPDATLVCSRDQAPRIKELVALLDERFNGAYT